MKIKNIKELEEHLNSNTFQKNLDKKIKATLKFLKSQKFDTVEIALVLKILREDLQERYPEVLNLVENNFNPEFKNYIG